MRKTHFFDFGFLEVSVNTFSHFMTTIIAVKNENFKREQQ